MSEQRGLSLNDGHTCHVERDEDDRPTTRRTPCSHMLCRNFAGRWPYKPRKADDDDDTA